MLWLTNFKALRLAEMENPAEVFEAPWRCDSDDTFDPPDRTLKEDEDQYKKFAFEVQIGQSRSLLGLTPPTPATTLSRATFTMIPAELAHRAMPDSAGTIPVLARMSVPWTNNWDFEEETTDDWMADNVTLTKYCCGYDAYTGGGYLYLEPNDQVASYISQFFRVDTHVKTDTMKSDWKRLPLGSRTGMHAALAFRCPVWSPRVSGKDTDYCKVTLRLKTVSNPTWWDPPPTHRQHGSEWHIAADGKWHAVEYKGAIQVSDDDIELRIDSHGYHLDVDRVWVSSGL